MGRKRLGLLSLAGLLPTITLAHGYGYGMGGGWNNHMGFGGGGLMTGIWILLLVLGVTLLVKWLTNFRNRPASYVNDNPKALSILAERYARGEITQEEYETKKEHLS